MPHTGQQNPPPSQGPPNPYPNQNPNQDPYQPSQQHPYQVPPSADGFAITSMVLGIIAVLTCYFGIILGVVAVIFGHLSLGKMKRDPKLGGRGMAIAGLATGYVGIAISIVFGVMLLFAASTAGVMGKGFVEAMEESVQKMEQQEEKERIKSEQESLKNETRGEPIPDQQ
jgi:Sec-independent protein translocase protein TatA